MLKKNKPLLRKRKERKERLMKLKKDSKKKKENTKKPRMQLAAQKKI